MNEQLIELEQQLADMSAKKLYFIYVSIVILLVYMTWNLLGENMQLEIQTKQNSVESLEKKLQDNDMKSFEAAIKKKDKECLLLKEQISQLNVKEKFIASKLEAIDFIFFTQKSIASLLDSILKYSIQYSVDIHALKYESAKEKFMPHVYEKEHINIDGAASYKNIVNLIQHIDSLNALLRIKSMTIYVDENQTTSFDLNISHYGVEL